MNSSAWTEFFKNRTMWKGVGLGVLVCVLLLAGLIFPNLYQQKMVVRDEARFYGYSERRAAYQKASSGYAPGGGVGDTVQADAPKIIYRADMDLLVDNFAETRKKVEALAAAESGFVESSTLDDNSARIILRVPSARFDAVRGKMRDLSIRVRQESVNAADVSKQYVDRESRLRNLRATEQQFLEVMKKAHTVPEVLAVTKELAAVRGEIESADAEFRHLKDQIDMSQIDVRLTSEVARGVRWAPGSTAKNAWNDMLQGLANLADFAIWLVLNLPVVVLWAVTIFLLAVVGWFVLRRAGRAMRAIFGKKPGQEANK